MEGNFTDMELTLAGAAMYLGGDETLYSIAASSRVVCVDCAVDNAVTSYAKDFCEFEGVVVDEGTDGRGRGWFRRRLLGRHASVCEPSAGGRGDRRGRGEGSGTRETMGWRGSEKHGERPGNLNEWGPVGAWLA